MAPKMASPMTSAGALLLDFLAMILLQLQPGLPPVQERRRRRDDVRGYRDVGRRPVPEVVRVRERVALAQELAYAVGLEPRSGYLGALQGVAEGRREVDGAVEVARRVGDGQGELEDERQAAREVPLRALVGKPLHVVGGLEADTKVLLADHAQGVVRGLLRVHLHRPKEFVDLGGVLLETREVPHAVEPGTHRFGLVCAGEAAELPDELAERQVAAAAAGVRDVGKDE